MAADKTHLRNLDKSYKLVPTDQKTDAGRIIYKNAKTGELHSELSVTVEYPANSGKWINVPSLLNGRVYNAKGVLAMLKKGKLVPTSTHMSEQKASEAAAYRSTTLQSNTGEVLEPANEIADYDPVKEAFVNQNMNTFASTFPTRDENPEGLFVVDTALDDQILGTDQASMEAAAANGYNLKELASIMDRANAEKDDSNNYVDVLRRPINNGTTSTADQEMFDAAKIERFGSEKGNVGTPGYNATNQGTVSPADQAMFDAAYQTRNFPDAGPKTRQSNKPNINANNINPDKQMQNSYNPVPDMMSDGPSTRGRNRQKPIFNFSMRPEEKMNDNRNIKGLTPDYGKMPGFKLPTNDKGETTGNYWSADENSDFWKTDAGYQKAQETWGQNLPTFVKKPQRKDIDIDAIKKFFTSSR